MREIIFKIVKTDILESRYKRLKCTQYRNCKRLKSLTSSAVESTCVKSYHLLIRTSLPPQLFIVALGTIDCYVHVLASGRCSWEFNCHDCYKGRVDVYHMYLRVWLLGFRGVHFSVHWLAYQAG